MSNPINLEPNVNSILTTFTKYPSAQFKFQNGDSYLGEFAFDRSIKAILKHGNGKYISKKGFTIQGKWHKDKPSGKMIVYFNDIKQYEGNLTYTFEYSLGTYYFPDGSRLEGDFCRDFRNYKNKSLKFYDPNGKLWDNYYDSEMSSMYLKFNCINNEQKFNECDKYEEKFSID